MSKRPASAHPSGRHLVEAGEPAAAAVVIEPEEAAATAAELAPARATVAHAVIRDLAG